ncbi:hypothetical protein KDU71_12500 [Carboxylicivirga sediminis]|uniref:STAS/SEC14 domain-containing protein n=1 Tax=Carboxylicivirga sediminis TaxID=2006564 RepID=A0A941IYD8_9BACT|nr:hypothetical protein [Carboxylicivirga sediminis]MBR8536384.1 hypothetical protein [Carboxylicivirga sediminis]
MDITLKYTIIKDKELVVEVLKGPVKLNDYISFKTQQIADKDFNPNYSYIIDIRAVDIVFSKEMEKRMKEYLAFVAPIDALAQEKRVAIITNTPEQVVYSTIHQTLDKRRIDYGIFSTKDSAIEWLNLNSDDLSMVD